MSGERDKESEWAQECNHFHGHELTGRLGHWCPDWDYLPIDEHCQELEACCCTWESGELNALADQARRSLTESRESGEKGTLAEAW
jgi:hypothetical protein